MGFTKMYKYNRLYLVLLWTALYSFCNADNFFETYFESKETQQKKCPSLSSCSSCVSESSCTWCVTKSMCTRSSCGNDNAIYPKNSQGLMAGDEFCPRIVEPEEPLILRSGKKEIIELKITQMHIYMAFTPWKCKIHLNDKEMIVNAIIVVDKVYCQTVTLNNESDSPYVDGNITLLWEYNKSLDGKLPIRVCRCDLDSSCVACK